MPTYLYRAKKGPDQIQKGQIEAPTKQEAATKIDSLGHFLISIKEKQLQKNHPSKVSLKDLVDFTQQLSTLVNSGSALVVSLDTLASQTEQARLQPVIQEVATEVKEGNDFSQALEKYPHIFSQLYTSLVKVGESSGTLGQNLRRIAEFLEEEWDFRANITSILTYPLLILAVGVITVFVLLRFVIPKLVDIFQEIGQTLPLSTSLLIHVSRFFSKYSIFIMAALIVSFLTIRRYFKHRHNKLRWDRMKLKIPLLGDILKKIEICRLARTLSVLLRNGVPIDRSLGLLSEATPNLFFQEEIRKIKDQIHGGSYLNEAMKASGIFTPTLINVVTVGEQSGTLDSVLENLSNDYNKEINRKIKNAMNLLEPFLILGVGLVVGFVVLSMLLPIFQIDFNF